MYSEEKNHESPLTGKKPQSNKPAAQHIFLVSLSMGGESEGQHLTEHSNNKENK